MKQCVLVIDDDALASQIISSELQREGHEVMSSLNFADAIQKAERSRPDLVLIDVVMPDITGFEACRKIKKMFEPKPPPVIVMTGMLNAVDPILARKMGADDFVVKTGDMAVLMRAVRNILSAEGKS